MTPIDHPFYCILDWLHYLDGTVQLTQLRFGVLLILRDESWRVRSLCEQLKKDLCRHTLCSIRPQTESWNFKTLEHLIIRDFYHVIMNQNINHKLSNSGTSWKWSNSKWFTFGIDRNITYLWYKMSRLRIVGKEIGNPSFNLISLVSRLEI